MTHRSLSQEIASITLAVISIGVLMTANFWILRPFLLALIWATIIVVASWPLMLLFQGWLGGRRPLAVVVMTVVLLLVFLLPFSLAVGTIVGNAEEIAGWVKGLETFSLPLPPDWVGKLPMVGGKLTEGWQKIAAAGPEGWRAPLALYTGGIFKWFVEQAGNVGMIFVQFLLTVIIAAVLYSGGETAARGVQRFAFRLTGRQGEEAAILAARTIRGVALGICLTALAQGLLAGIGFAAAGVPFASLLAAVIFILALAQLPPFLVMAPAVFWLYGKGDPVWGTALLVWTIIVGALDNVMRPFLIRKGVDLPILLIFTGVLGGLIAFGIIGLFIGPVVLAVTYTLIGAWIAGDDEPKPDPDSDGAPVLPTGSEETGRNNP